METAINIGYSSRLLTPETTMLYLIDDDADAIKKAIAHNLKVVNNSNNVNKSGETDFGLIIEGKVCMGF